MEYDAYGNITKKNGVTYHYDTVWKDRLIGVGNKTITYGSDDLNPDTYFGNVLVWEKGRQLKQFCESEYKYNANGIRTEKKANGVQHIYTLDGTKILREELIVGEIGGNSVIVPMYDANESVIGITYSSVAGTDTYYFLKNLQGDIVAITNDAGNVVARYRYDAWGKVLKVTDANGSDIDNTYDIAHVNPYRYRGYYYDTDTGLYYLQSRYYDPAVGRFINADESTTMLLFQDEVSGFNLFLYCKNSPVTFVDDLGLFSFDDIKKFFNKIIGGLKKRIEDYFKSLIIVGKKYISISTDIFSTAINLILGLILRSYVIKAFNCGLKIFKSTFLAFHTGKAVEIMTKIVNFLLYTGFGKFLVKILARQVVISAGLSTSIINVIAEGIFTDFVNSVNKLASKVLIVLSAFSSIGNLLAFVLCDLPDGNIDGRLKITW